MKFGTRVDVFEVVTRAEFDLENLRGVNFTGVNIWASYWLCLWALTQCSATALPVMMIVRPSDCSSLTICQNCQHDKLKTNEPILMPTGTNGPRGNGMKRSILGIKQSKEKCFQFSTLLCQPSFSTSTCAETISVAVARENGYIRRGQVLDDDDVKVQGHTRPKIDLDSGLMEALFSTPLSVWVWVARFHNPAWFRR